MNSSPYIYTVIEVLYVSVFQIVKSYWFQCILWISLACLQSSLSSQERNLQALQIAKDDIQLDGRINESFWENAEVATEFVMQVPEEGGSPTESTRVHIAYDNQNLYIGMDLRDSEISELKAFQKKRDVALDTDDQFQWILDTYLDGRNAYYFAVNPAGAQVDGLLTIGQGSSLNLNWDGIWHVWTHVHAEGWSVEVRIPFRSLNFDRNLEEWGINFQRTIRRKNEEVLWEGHRRSQGLLRPQNAGRLTGLENISQGLGLEMIPYTAIRNQSTRQDDQLVSDFEAEVGLDVNYNITPGLKASLTYNTDFAEADVDARRINLTRFPLLFPETRDFFLEGSNIYSFAPASGVRPYFSRTIGLLEGSTVPIVLGARILGRVGKSDVAIQHVKTGESDVNSGEDFSVFRIKNNIGKESRIGFVYTRRSTEEGDMFSTPLQDRHSLGADIELGTSKFLGSNNFQFQAFFVYHNNDSPLNPSEFWDRTTRGVRINFPNRPWFGHASYREFGVDFEPAIGFHPRVGFRRFQPSLGFNPLFSKSKVIRDISFGLRFEHLMDMSWELLTQEIQFELFEVTFESAERIAFAISRQYERLTRPFDILRDGTIVIPEDEYVNWTIDLEMATASFRPIAMRVDINSGDFWSGSRVQFASSLVVRPKSGLNFTFSYIHTDVDLPEGAFNTDLMRFNASIDISPFVSFNSFVQYDNLSDQIGINNRLRWIIAPGNDLYIVYNHNWLDTMDRFVTLTSTTTAKLSYTFRF